jgi:hypothetical protein
MDNMNKNINHCVAHGFYWNFAGELEPFTEATNPLTTNSIATESKDLLAITD